MFFELHRITKVLHQLNISLRVEIGEINIEYSRVFVTNKNLYPDKTTLPLQHSKKKTNFLLIEPTTLENLIVPKTKLSESSLNDLFMVLWCLLL